MSVSQTMMGITQRQVLVGTVADQVVALDKRFLDPRRPTKVSPADKDEGLLPYSEIMPVFPRSYLTMNKQVEQLRSIFTAPARLESSCLVLAVGLDVFYTRTMPSKTYDMVAEDFSYALLMLTLVGLTVLTLTLRFLVKREELKRRWR